MKVPFGPFTLDVEARQLTRAGATLHLSTKAFDLLTILVSERPAVVEKSALRDRLWPGVHVVDAGLTNLVAEIRSVLKTGAAESSYVRTVHGVGYAFAAGDEPEHGRPAPFWLVVNDRPVSLAPGDHVVGRDVGCGVWLDAEGVSRRHARIRVPETTQAGAVTIHDLSSTNGTYVQGSRISRETALANGDRIRMGHATLVFRTSAADAPTRRVKVRKP